MNVKLVENKAEMDDALSVRKTVFVEEQNVPMEEEIDSYEQESSHFVLYDGNMPAGAGRFRILDGKGKIERICVLKELRGTGAGMLIMKEIEEFARKKGISKLKLNAQTHAIGFYSKLGYSVASEEFLDAGIPHRSMEKALIDMNT